MRDLDLDFRLGWREGGERREEKAMKGIYWYGAISIRLGRVLF